MLLLAAAWWRPEVFLWLLGAKYAHLSSELLLALGGQGLSLLTGVCWGLIVVRGWVRHAWMTIVTALLGYAGGAILFPLDQVWGLLAFSLASNVPTLLLCLAVAARKMSRLEAEEVAQP